MKNPTVKASCLFSRVGCLAGILCSLVAPSAVANTFSTGFESGLPPGTALFGSAFVDSAGGINGSGALKLTTAGNVLQGSFIIHEIDGSAPVTRFTAEFKMLIGGGSGADGLSFNFANDLPDAPFGEEGAGTGLTVSFDTFDNGGGEAPAIDVKVGGAVVASVPGSALFRTGDYVDVRIQVGATGLNVAVNGTPIFANLPVALDTSNSGRFGFGARTGGLNDHHFIDDLTITTDEPGHPVVTSSTPRGNTVRPDAVVRITIQDFVTEVDPASIQLRFDGTPVSPMISKTGSVTTVQYDPPGLLPVGSSHVVSLAYSDNGSPVFMETVTYDFTVADSSGPNGNYYEVVLVPTPISWPEAKAAADTRIYNGVLGHLATITSAEEDKHLEKLRQQNRPPIGMSQLWVGGSQKVPGASPTEDWFWENDEGPISGFNGGGAYANWIPGEPNDYWGPATENYLAIGLRDAFGWNDDGFLDGGRLGGYIVEFELNGARIPTVSIEATQWRTAEPCPTCFVAPGVLTIWRTAPTNSPLTVVIQADGTATSEVDYEALPPTVTIPAGQTSVQFHLLAKDDLLVEGPEVARVRLVPSLDYLVQSDTNEALIVIQDDEPNAPTARIDIISPADGARFAFPQSIELSAIAVNLSNEVYNSEFYADGLLIARVQRDGTTQPPIPGFPSVHNASWNNPPFGHHVLTARGQISTNDWVTSPPVNVTVDEPTVPVVRLETRPLQNAQALEFCPPNADCAYPSFVVSRSGPTNAELRVYLSYSGTATPGSDYPQLPGSVVIPAGSDAVFLTLVPTDDTLVEGLETVVAQFTPIPGPTYLEDPSASSAKIAIIDNEPPPSATVNIIRPANGASFIHGQTIDIEAVAIDPGGYISYVEFFAGDQRIGVSSIQFIWPPPDGTPITHRLEWRNAPVGTHELTARAPRANGELVISPPVQITVRDEPPGDRELHVMGVYTGTAPDGGVSQNNEQGDAAVIINRPGKRVTLVLSAYEPVVWHLTVGDATVVDRIILGGYYVQKVVGVGTEVEIIHATFPSNPANYLYVGYSLDCAEVYRAFEKIRAMTGLGILSFHGGYQAPYPTPTLIDSVQDDPRLAAEYPVPTPASQLPNLGFGLSFHKRGSGGDLFTRQYTLAGPLEDSRLLPATRVIRDGGTRYFFGLQWHEPFRVDTHTGAEQAFEPPSSLPELSWPWGLTYDPQRNRVLLVSFGGEGYLYGFSPNTEQWSLVRSMDNRDVESLEYHAATDSLYALTVFGGECSSPWVVKLAPDGQFQSQFPLNLQGYGPSLGTHSTELVSVGEYLVLLLEPTNPNDAQSESRMYLIDPRTGQSWLTYRSRGGNPPNQTPQVAIVQPANGTEFPPDTGAIEIAASARDPDGYVRRVEFFADGRRIGESSVEFIVPPPPGQTQYFSFTWREPAPGPQILTARATDDDDGSTTSQGVQIRVGASNALPVICVTVPDSYAVEPSSNATPVLDIATFRIGRSGPTNETLEVTYTLRGTAQNGIDYELLPPSVRIPAGARSATVTVRPVADNLTEDIESIVLELREPPPVGLPSALYLIGSQRHAAAVISDPEPTGETPAATCTPVAGDLLVSFRATSGNYRVEASTDLITWETVATTAAINGTVHFVETDRATFPRRFYRIVPEPMPLVTE